MSEKIEIKFEPKTPYEVYLEGEIQRLKSEVYRLSNEKDLDVKLYDDSPIQMQPFKSKEFIRVARGAVVGTGNSLHHRWKIQTEGRDNEGSFHVETFLDEGVLRDHGAYVIPNIMQEMNTRLLHQLAKTIRGYYGK